MIKIVNVTPNPQPTGLHTYEIRINHKVITTFEHYREDGLSTCLEKAARAVSERKETPYMLGFEELSKLFDDLVGEK